MTNSRSPNNATDPVSSGLDPFVDGHGQVSYFMTPTLRQRIDLVRHLLSFGRQIVVLTGVSGSGKSALLAQITGSGEENWRVLNFTAGPTLNYSAILRRILVELELDDVGADPDLLARVQTHVEQAHGRGESLLITIDDADGLPADAADCLAQLAHGAQESLETKILLSIDPSNSSIIDQLQSDNGAQALLHVVEVPRLSDEQTNAMLAHRWTTAYGDGAELPLSATELAQIVEQAGGLPGRAIVLARQVQILASNANHPKHDPAQRYLLGGIALIVAFALFAFFNEQPTSDGKSTQIALELPGELVNAETETRVAPAMLEETAIDESVAILPPAPLAPLPMAEKPLATTSAPEDQSEIVAPTEPDSMTSTAKPGASTQRASDATPTADETPPELDAKANLESPAAVATTTKTSPPPTKPPPPPPPPTPSPPSPKVPTAQYSLKWLKGQPSTGYVLQLFGVRDENAAKKFIKVHKIADKSAIFATTHRGAPWYVVVYDYFPSRDAARAAISDLPSDLTRLKPWAKPLNSID